jgi:2-polyprenyl-3-methyl-5-hydroxy-6-metoxy-1,4-benzoquinol methylase
MSDIKKYYNSKDWIEAKIKEYINGNRRIDYCLSFFDENISTGDVSVLEIGCSIGLTTIELASRYSRLLFTGVDIAEEQVNFANKYFKLANSNFLSLDITSDNTLNEKFDLITMFDVYEHIQLSKREEFNAALGKLLNNNGKILITCPSWIISERKINSLHGKIQVVDEIVGLDAYARLAKEINGQVVSMKLVSVWEKFDYCHCVISREEPLTPIEVKDREVSVLEKICIRLGISKKQQLRKNRMRIISDHLGDIS